MNIDTMLPIEEQAAQLFQQGLQLEQIKQELLSLDHPPFMVKIQIKKLKKLTEEKKLKQAMTAITLAACLGAVLFGKLLYSFIL